MIAYIQARALFDVAGEVLRCRECRCAVTLEASVRALLLHRGNCSTLQLLRGVAARKPVLLRIRGDVREVFHEARERVQ
jgi:hypothetical protein